MWWTRAEKGNAYQMCKPFLLLAALLLYHELHPVRQVGRSVLALVMLHDRLYGALLALQLHLLGFGGMVHQDLQDMHESFTLNMTEGETKSFFAEHFPTESEHDGISQFPHCATPVGGRIGSQWLLGLGYGALLI